jgi:Leu/Phe-tRNA-protein transferase
MLYATVDRGLLGFLIGSRKNDELLVSHLLFADYTLIFCKANTEHLHHLGRLFLCFEAVSRLKLTWLNQS